MPKPTAPPKNCVVYHYRGLIEMPKLRKGRPSFRWFDGWSENGANGGATYPWMSRQQCLQDAKSRDAKAVFVRPESTYSKRSQ